MRVILAIGLIFALGGCTVVAIPPAVTIASYAVDGISYMATGKSLTDHAISEVAGEDCVLIRAAVLENPCKPYVKPDSELAVELETSYGGSDVSTQLAEADLAAEPAERRGAASRMAQRRSAPAVLASAEPARRAAPARYIVVGSFRERANAERSRRAHASQGAAIVPVSVHGRPFYRVVTPSVAAPPVRDRGGATWAIAPCRAGATAPCLDRADVRRARGRLAAAPDRQLTAEASARPTLARAELGG